MPLVYESLHFECAYRADLIVDRQVIVEVKSIESFHPIHSPKLLTDLRLAKLKLSLLINFNVLHLKDGIKRVANGL